MPKSESFAEFKDTFTVVGENKFYNVIAASELELEIQNGVVLMDCFENDEIPKVLWEALEADGFLGMNFETIEALQGSRFHIVDFDQKNVIVTGPNIYSSAVLTFDDIHNMTTYFHKRPHRAQDIPNLPQEADILGASESDPLRAFPLENLSGKELVLNKEWLTKNIPDRTEAFFESIMEVQKPSDLFQISCDFNVTLCLLNRDTNTMALLFNPEEKQDPQFVEMSFLDLYEYSQILMSH
jgi:hypothetical protein